MAIDRPGRSLLLGALVAIGLGYALARQPSLPEVEAPAPPAWSLPEPPQSQAAEARKRLASLRPWGGDSAGEQSAEAAGGGQEAKSWTLHGIVRHGGRPVALFVSSEGEVRRVTEDQAFPPRGRVIEIAPDGLWLVTDGERRSLPLYDPTR
jgi:hypothetical protein